MTRHLKSSSARKAERAGIVLLLVAAAMLIPGWFAVSAWAIEAEASPSPPRMIMSPAGPQDTTPRVDLILQGLVCRCGCNLTVQACEGSMTCDVAKKMRSDVEARIAKGETDDQVFAGFAADYGEQVLAAPTKKGFNLVAWFLPFVVLAGGALVILRVLRRDQPVAATAGAETATPAAPIDPDYAAAVEDELRRED